MKRDMDTIRKLLLWLEEKESSGIHMLSAADFPECEDYLYEHIQFHLKMLEGSPFIETGGIKSHRQVAFKGLTWEGRDFLDKIRDDDNWNKTKDRVKQIGSWSIGVVGEVAAQVVKQKLTEIASKGL